MVIINAGGPGGGAAKVTQDVTTIMSQLPAVVEALSGVKLETLIQNIPGMKAEEKKSKE